jgi:two-component system, cell cycle sensor histidine kinase and response regulator CckA
MPRRQNSEQDINQEILKLRRRVAELEAEAALTKLNWKTKPKKGTKDAHLSGRMQEGIPISDANANTTEDPDTVLREDEELHAKLLAVIPDPVIRTDLAGEILFVNDNTLQRSGYTREEFIGKSIFSFLSPEDLPQAMDNMKLRLEQPLEPVEYQFITKSGAIIHIEVNGDILRNEEGTPYGTVLVCRDITERKKTEQSLKESRQRLASIIDSLPEPALVIDCHGVAIAWNRAAEKLSGVKAEDMLGKGNYEYSIPFYGYRRPTLIDLVLNPDPKLEEVYKGVFRQGDSVFGEAYMPKLSDGTRFLWGSATALRDSEGNIIGAIETLRDITDRKRDEEALKEWEERYRLLSEASFEYIAVTDRGVFVDANKQMLDMLGYTHEEIVGRPVSDILAPESVELVMKNIRNGYEEPYENYLRKKDGTCFPVISRARSMLWGGRKYRVTVLQDITEAKKAEEEQKRLEEQVYQSHKLEALGTLAGGIAHDFNNLLMAIQGYASLMLLECNPEDRHYERLKNIEKQIKSGADLTKQLLGFARGGKYETQPTDINDLLAQNSEMFARTKREIKIQRRFAEDIWTIEVDRGQMDQVFLNLYINAWQSMPAGGNLYIETQNIFLDDQFAKPYDLSPGKYVKISVTDTGYGMDEKTLQRIFEPFFTTKAVSRGSGLGLASAYGIIRNHGGAITVYSQKGYGTTFNIYLPASEKTKEKEAIYQAQAERGSETILVVDDDPANIDVISQMLVALGYTVLTATGGLQAFEVYQQSRKDIDLVILDMIMPGLSGGETFDKIREINPDVRVILSSGYSVTGQAKAILDRGVKAFIQKPFTTGDFSMKIREALEK